jgi:hypothetical protein
VLLWGVAVVLLVFSIISGMTIGLFYLPAAGALLVAAVLCNSWRASRRVWGRSFFADTRSAAKTVVETPAAPLAAAPQPSGVISSTVGKYLL